MTKKEATLWARSVGAERGFRRSAEGKGLTFWVRLGEREVEAVVEKLAPPYLDRLFNALCQQLRSALRAGDGAQPAEGC